MIRDSTCSRDLKSYKDVKNRGFFANYLKSGSLSKIMVFSRKIEFFDKIRGL